MSPIAKIPGSDVAQLALLTMSTGREGWNGTGAWTNGKQFRNIRALFPMYDNPLQAMVLQKSGITTLAQLDGKRIGVGPPSGTGASYGPVIFKIVGISPQLSSGSYDDMATKLLDGRIDALVTLLAAGPVPTIQQVDARIYPARGRRSSRSCRSARRPGSELDPLRASTRHALASARGSRAR